MPEYSYQVTEQYRLGPIYLLYLLAVPVKRADAENLELHHVRIWISNLAHEVSDAPKRGKNALCFVSWAENYLFLRLPFALLLVLCFFCKLRMLPWIVLQESQLLF